MQPRAPALLLAAAAAAAAAALRCGLLAPHRALMRVLAYLRVLCCRLCCSFADLRVLDYLPRGGWRRGMLRGGYRAELLREHRIRISAAQTLRRIVEARAAAQRAHRPEALRLRGVSIYTLVLVKQAN
jgi:hypothetical protein